MNPASSEWQQIQGDPRSPVTDIADPWSTQKIFRFI